jgi:hypothetical protein
MQRIVEKSHVSVQRKSSILVVAASITCFSVRMHLGFEGIIPVT